MNKLKEIFRVGSTYQLIIVFIVFGITGSLSLILSEYISNIYSLNNILVSMVLILLTYQVLLIIVGTMFGQFQYFWTMEKKIFRRLSVLKKFNKL